MDLSSLGSPDELIAGAFFGLVGMAYFMFGKKRAKYLWMGSGAGLMVYPYFTSGMAMMIVVGAALIAFPFVAAKYL